MSEKTEATFMFPGIGGSLGKCALCGGDFLMELVLGQNISTIKCSWFPDQTLPMHKTCADKCGQGMVATDLPEGPLRTAWEQSQDANADSAPPSEA